MGNYTTTVVLRLKEEKAMVKMWKEEQEATCFFEIVSDRRRSGVKDCQCKRSTLLRLELLQR